MSKMTIEESLEVADRWARETVITVGNNALPYACVALAAEVRRLREREARARELATITVDTLDDLRADALRDEWSRWLETE